jgi:hypothetical protein
MHTKTILRFKGLYRISSQPGRDTFARWHNEVENWPENAQGYAYDAFEEIAEGYDFYAIQDSETDELVAVATYEILGELPESFEKIEWFNTPYYHAIDHFDEFVYLSQLAGIGRGGGVEIVKDIMQIGQINNAPVLVWSSSYATKFYERAGFTPIGNYRYVFFPKNSLEKIEGETAIA